MHEVLYVAASSRLPIVMAVANRALSGPLNVWGDHSDVMATRDCGWIQYFTENAQEAFDLTLCAFKIAEDPQVLFPVMVNLDGFFVSHVVEPLYLLEKEELEGFIPPLKYPYPLDPKKPVTMGAFAPPVLYSEAKKAQEEALRSTKDVILRVWKEFGERFGRSYNPIETYRAEDADTLLLASAVLPRQLQWPLMSCGKKAKRWAGEAAVVAAVSFCGVARCSQGSETSDCV